MKNIKLIIEYDGTNYHGWQSQINAVSVQDVMEEAIEKLTGKRSRLTASGRTDVGVHALGQTANFFTDSTIPAERFAYALDGILPKDIVVKSSEEVPDDFHARFSATGKKYRYVFYDSERPSALYRNRACHVPETLDIESLKRAAEYFAGTHDFSGFMSTGSSVKTTVRTIYDVLVKKDGDFVKFEISGSGFLYNMVRIIAGTLICVGTGKIPAEDIAEIIRRCDRTQAGRTAPAHGLYLVEVYY